MNKSKLTWFLLIPPFVCLLLFSWMHWPRYFADSILSGEGFRYHGEQFKKRFGDEGPIDPREFKSFVSEYPYAFDVHITKDRKFPHKATAMLFFAASESRFQPARKDWSLEEKRNWDLWEARSYLEANPDKELPWVQFLLDKTTTR